MRNEACRWAADEQAFTLRNQADAEANIGAGHVVSVASAVACMGVELKSQLHVGMAR